MSQSKSSVIREAPASHQNRPQPPVILVVDDTKAIRIVLRMQLKLLGYRTLEAESGQEALEICARECPDLILMDVSMPDLDGLGTTRLLRQAAATMYIPIVAFSAFHSSDFRECALAAGCNDFVTKPIEMKNLDDIIARNLGNHAEI